MKILIVAATEIEISGLKGFSNIDFLTTGIGSSYTLYKLSKKLIDNKYDIIINVGIAGSYTPKHKIGDVVQVKTETFGDLGFEDKNSFIPISKSKFGASQAINFTNNSIYFLDSHIPFVNSVTVNTSSGQSQTIKERIRIFKADIENMEGAAVFMICNDLQIPFVEIRAISNFIEERNTKNWDIPLALQNLHKETIQFINQLIEMPNA